MNMPSSPSLSTRVLCVLWPSFLMAGVTEMLVFAVVDPGTLQWFGAEPMQWPPQAVYTLAFLAFWLLISTAGALTQLLANTPDSLAERSRHAI